MIKQKKGVSPIIGYVLLVAGVIAISALIYPWMKSYVPQEAVACKDGSSLFLKSVSCLRNTTNQGLELRTTLRNNGLFNLDGFMIYGTENAEELATIDLTPYAGGTEGLILFKDGREALEPNEEINYIFYIGTAQDLKNIKKIEIIPTRFEEINNKKRFAVCGNSKIEELITCTDLKTPSLIANQSQSTQNYPFTISWDTGDNSYGQVYYYRTGDETTTVFLGAGVSGSKSITINTPGTYVFKLFAGTEKQYVLAITSVNVV